MPLVGAPWEQIYFRLKKNFQKSECQSTLWPACLKLCRDFSGVDVGWGLISGLTPTLCPQSGQWSFSLSVSSISLPSFLPPSHFSLVITCMFPHSLKHATLFPTSLLFITVSRTTSCRSVYEPNPTQHKAHLYMLLITIMSEVLWGGHYLTWQKGVWLF